jgi:hypothetical protein
MSTITHRLIGSAGLSANSYEEVEADRHANWQAVGIVLLSSVGAAIGTGIHNLEDTLLLVTAATAAWIVWVLLTMFIGTQLLPGNHTRADFGEVLRTTGFSATPGIFRALGILPVIGRFLFIAATVWMLFSFVVAVRQALDYDNTGRALAVCVLGWILHGVLFAGFIMTAL